MQKEYTFILVPFSGVVVSSFFPFSLIIYHWCRIVLMNAVGPMEIADDGESLSMIAILGKLRESLDRKQISKTEQLRYANEIRQKL